MFASLSSSSSSAPVSDIISQWKNSCIQSCVLGISKIGMTSNLSTKISHAAILLLNKEIDYDEDDDNIILETNGILIEYGLVVYHYGEKGGLRYYIKKYGNFIEEFGDIGYIDLNIHSDNQISFDTFLDKIAKLEDNKWTLNNYSAYWNFNCQNFAIEALHELNPHFVIGNIYPKDPNLAAKKSKKKLDFVPSNIKEELLKLYKNGKK